jgi:hypothetical protein
VWSLESDSFREGEFQGEMREVWDGSPETIGRRPARLVLHAEMPGMPGQEPGSFEQESRRGGLRQMQKTPQNRRALRASASHDYGRQFWRKGLELAFARAPFRLGALVLELQSLHARD